MENTDVAMVLGATQALANFPAPRNIYKASGTSEAFWSELVESMKPYENVRQNEIDFPPEKWQSMVKGMAVIVDGIGWEITQVTGFTNVQYAALIERIRKALPSA
jgi:hypothetical protein